MRPCALSLLLVLSLRLSLETKAEIVVDGISHREVAVDAASFRVRSEAGFGYECRLNGHPIPTDRFISCAADYYDLSIRRTQLTSGETSDRLIQFIVRSSQRGGSEVGLRPWVPLPLIQSAPAEFEGSQLLLIGPRSLPVTLDLPLIALIQNTEGEPVRVNGLVIWDAPAAGSLQIRRGYGSTLIPDTQGPGTFTWQTSIAGLAQSFTVTRESSTTWTPIGGTLAGRVEWPENSRLEITNHLIIPAAAELHVGAGSILKLAPGVNVDVTGSLTVSGTLANPVLFTPERRSAPWGGMFFRTNSSLGNLRGTILTGSGANPKWFTENTGYNVHRKEQALLLVENGAAVTLTECFLIDNFGQAGHGKNAFLTLNHSLIQRCLTGGEYSGGSVKLMNSALIEFPQDDGIFADDDNDAIYFTTGDHFILNSLIGWAKDDALDAGTGGLGSMTVSNSWIESNFHEGMAWSGDNGRKVNVGHTVVMNCGQGIEAGFGKPTVQAGELLSLGNLTGARFGDNYDWTYAGFLRITNSILLHNFRDIWGQTWTPGAWTNELDQMDIQGNRLTSADPLFPRNAAWDSSADGPSLARFLGALATRPVGVGFALREPEVTEADWTNGVPVGLSRFHTQTVTVTYRVEHSSGALIRSGELNFEPGRTIHRIPPIEAATPGEAGFYVLKLDQASGASITGRLRAFYSPLEPSAPFTTTFIGKRSTWRYWDRGSEPAGNWRALNYADSEWASGRAELGFGDGDEGTIVAIGPAESHFTGYYFRRTFNVDQPQHLTSLSIGLLRDDGGVVYLNGTEVFRSNMRPGTVQYEDTAAGNASSETTYYPTNVAAAGLLPGVNVIAAEVHQSQTNSSDLSFDLELVGQHAAPRPTLRWVNWEGDRWLVWRQVGFVLQSAASIDGPWTTESKARSPQAIVALARNRFYRLALP
ncbi:MAG: hypothetical protein JNN07_18795 [Verrucomicrobiales bacterium]|nr:hypothetical protein [Verrucomicrobiales bacterium]